MSDFVAKNKQLFATPLQHLIYLSDWGFTPYLRIFNIYNGDQQYGGQKPGQAILSLYSQRGNKYELDVEKQRG